ncbi:MAG: hypothetical protein KBS68_02040 [Clostridiales bacterium]|nr:hypothetical protein [Candidatus Crickella merdequi]
MVGIIPREKELKYKTRLELVEGLQALLEAKISVCPICGGVLQADFYRWEDGLGYGMIFCDNCESRYNICRIKYPDYTKANTILLRD